MAQAVPPWVAEDHECDRCRFAYVAMSVETALCHVACAPAALRAAVDAVAGPDRTARPEPATWSVTEYACHLRDIYMSATIRLYRARTEDAPALEPMLNDLRAVRFRYNAADVTAVLDEVEAAAAGCCDEAARLTEKDWDRPVTRLPGERRTARWLLRQAAHEGVHHVEDVRIVTATVAAGGGVRSSPEAGGRHG